MILKPLKISRTLLRILGGTIKEMMEAEMDDHLGYQKSERSDSDDYRNGYKSKRVNSNYGSMDILSLSGLIKNISFLLNPVIHH